MGRIPVVCDAISQLKREIGDQAVIGGMLTGPYTLLSLLIESTSLFTGMKREPQIVHDALSHLSAFLCQIGQAYKAAGADFLTIHEMGGSPAFLGPPRFSEFVLPALQSMISNLPGRRVLAVCGNVGAVAASLAEVGADALSLDQSNDLEALRAELPRTLLFGNVDPVAVLAHGTPDETRLAVRAALEAGVDAVWPGCDVYPLTPLDNLRALLNQ
jgi:[methyl-Co(III) methanol-specific corrinoid protein]:coenzyme M methyltransferase